VRPHENAHGAPAGDVSARRAAVVALLTIGATSVVLAIADGDVITRALDAIAHEPLPLVVALGAYTLAFAVRASAWQPLLPVAVPFALRLRALLAAIAVNHALPGPVGELARARMVSREDGLPLGRAVLSVAAARVADVGAIAFLLVAAAWAAGDAPAWVRWASPGALALPPIAWVIAARRGASLAPREALRVALLVVPSWLLECGVVWAVASAAGIELSLAGAVLATCCGVLAQVAAVLPGGIGTYEAGTASALVAVGVAPGEAVAVAATTHAVKFAYAFAVGTPALLLGRPTIELGVAPARMGAVATAGSDEVRVA
jgi:glycosyltransferase AglD